jgi:hypothetical protein
MDNFVGEKHKAAYGFCCCWERALEDKRSKSTKAVEDLKQAPVGNSQASLPVHQPPATVVPLTARVIVVQTPQQNMEDASDLTLDDSKPAVTVTVHNNESKVPKREPRTSGPKRKGNDGMNTWWMGLARGAKQKLFPLLSEEELQKNYSTILECCTKTEQGDYQFLNHNIQPLHPNIPLALGLVIKKVSTEFVGNLAQEVGSQRFTDLFKEHAEIINYSVQHEPIMCKVMGDKEK